MHVPGDEELMLAVGRGDAAAFAELVRRHQSVAWCIAYRYNGNREDAEDLVQDAFLKLLNAAPRYRPTAAFRTYFTCIISRLCLDSVRKKRPSVGAELPDVVDPAPTPDVLLVDFERAAAVRRALGQLPPQQRLAVILRYYENYGYRDIAEALEITAKAAERLLARGREKLGVLLQDTLGDAGGGF
jgi:RNA polymerase sigma-70 factor, ECF subfamily